MASPSWYMPLNVPSLSTVMPVDQPPIPEVNRYSRHLFEQFAAGVQILRIRLRDRRGFGASPDTDGQAGILEVRDVDLFTVRADRTWGVQFLRPHRLTGIVHAYQGFDIGKVRIRQGTA